MHSNAYTYRFIIILTGIAALLLSVAATSLKAKQDFNREIETKKNILLTVGLYEKGMTPLDVQDSFDTNIHKKYISADGIPGESVSDLGLFIYGSSESPLGYILPISGKGLWSTINGFFALEPDLNTVKGITFYEHGETPGLGGEIEKDWFISQFPGKKIFDGGGNLVSVTIAKAKAPEVTPYIVDGVSGATLTTKGVNEFILSDLRKYESFLRTQN